MSYYLVLVLCSFFVDVLAQPNPMHDPSISVLSSLFGAGGHGRRGQPFPPMMPSRFPDYFDSIPPPLLQNQYLIGSPPPMISPDPIAIASLMSYVTDKDNFQPQGCGWDAIRNRCTDGLNICKGGCFDFSNDITHDCRCVPFGYMALLGIGK